MHKPSGLHTHPSALSPREDSAARWLSQQLGQRIWTVHRLDRGASGLLLFALDAPAAARLTLAFREQRVHKRYLCLVRGWPSRDGEPLDEGLIERPLRDMDPASRQPALQDAVTPWRSLARLEAPFPSGQGEHAHPTTRISLLECRPRTGRMHQIRRHLAGIGHPLLGDGEHGNRPFNRQVAQATGLARLALCCVELELCGVEKQDLRLCSGLDPDLRRVLAALGLPDPTAHVTTPALFDGVLRQPGRTWRERAARQEARAAGASPAGGRRTPTPAEDQQAGPCPLCGDPAQPFHAEGVRRWRSCASCGLLHLEPELRASLAEREERRRLHHNSSEDPGYRSWLRPVVDALVRRVDPGALGLELGGGAGSVLAGLLREAGLQVGDGQPAASPACAWLCACEVLEGLEEPGTRLAEWNRQLAPGGWLALSMALVERDDAFPDWSFSRDPAHLSFARPRTLDWLAARHGWRLEREGRVILFHKPAPGS